MIDQNVLNITEDNNIDHWPLAASPDPRNSVHLCELLRTQTASDHYTRSTVPVSILNWLNWSISFSLNLKHFTRWNVLRATQKLGWDVIGKGVVLVVRGVIIPTFRQTYQALTQTHSNSFYDPELRPALRLLPSRSCLNSSTGSSPSWPGPTPSGCRKVLFSSSSEIITPWVT